MKELKILEDMADDAITYGSYIVQAGPDAILAIAEAFRALEQRAVAAEALAAEVSVKCAGYAAANMENLERAEAAEATIKQQDELILSYQETIRQQAAKLAELDKQQDPVAWMVQFGGTDREVFTDEQSAVRLLRDVSENGFLEVSIYPLCRKPSTE